ncbi:MAG TPA: MoxR family ATPase [Steroidobacteraceae bacterium]|jgi:MoxR-like ATPase|nr:MoxR family ATPase [Steroidobacteraceae bacterium]
MSTPLQDLEQALQRSLNATVIGLEGVIHSIVIAIVARGHVLIQGAPGLGKTLLSKTLAAALGGSFKRVQGTADLMPSDIIGVHVFDNTRNEFSFRPGPLFTEVLLFDEINRAGPKTQSALLEAMEERQVSVERKLYRLPTNFLVVATQNPRDFEGTYPLPESQLDRFMLRIDLSYPTHEHELQVLNRYGTIVAEPATATGSVHAPVIITPELLLAARQAADAIHVAPELAEYVLSLAKASREHTALTLGLSTRGALALLRAARIEAGLRGGQFVTPDDVKAVVPQVLPHRLMLSSEALLEGSAESDIARRLLEQVAVPR